MAPVSTDPSVTPARAVPEGAVPESSTRTGAQAVDRALGVLSTFLDGEELALSDIARRRGLTVSTAHRLLQALVRAGYVDQDDLTERYRLGRTAAVLGQAAARRFRLDVAQPLLDGLAERTGETANLGIRDGSDVVIVLAAESDQPLRFERAPGSRTPAHASAIGKVLLAFGRDDVDTAVSGLGPLERFTPRTIVEPGALRHELEQIRKRGVALNREERFSGVSAVAVPVRDGEGIARTAVGVQVPSARLDRERIASLGAEVRAVATELATLLPLAFY